MTHLGSPAEPPSSLPVLSQCSQYRSMPRSSFPTFARICSNSAMFVALPEMTSSYFRFMAAKAGSGFSGHTHRDVTWYSLATPPVLTTPPPSTGRTGAGNSGGELEETGIRADRTGAVPHPLPVPAASQTGRTGAGSSGRDWNKLGSYWGCTGITLVQEEQ